jgi:2-furoyl-CoA dehydrogenase large subunit
METFGVIAHFERSPDRYTVWSNFQGPFVLQPLMAGALRVPGHRLRLITPPSSGGSFGIKQAILSYIVLLAAVSRKASVPIKWIEDRAEHLTAASASSDRLGKISAALTGAGELTALRFHNVANMGAYIRAPEPASLYRMHAASNGCYRVRSIAIENELVVTNRTPVGLNRGYGGSEVLLRSNGSWTSQRADWISIPRNCGAGIHFPMRFPIRRPPSPGSTPATTMGRSRNCCALPTTTD